MPLTRARQQHPGWNSGRLSLESGVAVSVTDQTAKTSVRWEPYKGNRVWLRPGGLWMQYATAALSVAVPSTLFRGYDVYMHADSGVPALETTNWDQTTGSITAATAAEPCVVTSNSHGLSNGDLVGIAGIVGTLGTDSGRGLNDRVWRVANVATNTFECEGSVTTSLSYTSGGTWYRIPNTRTTALGTQDGVLVKSGDPTRAYWGSGMTTGVSGETADAEDRRLLWTYYHRRPRPVKKAEATDNWTNNTDAWNQANRAATNKNYIQLFVGVREDEIHLQVLHMASWVAGTVYPVTGVGVNQRTASSSTLVAFVGVAAAGIAGPKAIHRQYPAAGYGFYAWLEQPENAAGTAVTWYSTSGDLRACGLSGTHWC